MQLLIAIYFVNHKSKSLFVEGTLLTHSSIGKVIESPLSFLSSAKMALEISWIFFKPGFLKKVHNEIKQIIYSKLALSIHMQLKLHENRYIFFIYKYSFL